MFPRPVEDCSMLEPQTYISRVRMIVASIVEKLWRPAGETEKSVFS